MNLRPTLSLLCLSALLAAPLFAQDKPKEPAAGPGGMDPAAMEAMMKAAQPGAKHKILGGLVGDGSFTMKMWLAPGQPPAESKGTVHAEWILGGRYVQSIYKGEFMGQPFEGRGIDGYDNVAQRYVGSWVDNAGTGIMNSTGSCEEASKTCTMTAEILDPTNGKKVTTRTVTALTGGGHKMEMFMKDDSGEMKTMELVVTHKK